MCENLLWMIKSQFGIVLPFPEVQFSLSEKTVDFQYDLEEQLSSWQEFQFAQHLHLLCRLAISYLIAVKK